MTIRTSSPLRFGLYEFDPGSGELRKRGLVVRLSPQAKALLRIFVEAPNGMLSREEIQRRLWPGNTFVDFEHGVNKVVHSLREALGESAKNPRFIETVAAEGYRFLSSSLEQAPSNVKPRSKDAIERLAVLPLNTDGDADLRSMGRMVNWFLTERLAVIPGIRVMAESMVRCQKLEDVNPQQAGECLGVEAVLVGDLKRHDGQLILQFELIDVVDGARLGGVLIERVWEPGSRCEKELALEAFRRIRPILDPLSISRKPPQRVVLVEDSETAFEVQQRA